MAGERYIADQIIGSGERTLEQRVTNLEGAWLYSATGPEYLPDEETRAEKVFVYDADGNPYLFTKAALIQPAIDAAATDATTKANAAYASARQRSNHTGTQAQSTIVDLVSDLAGKVPVAVGLQYPPGEPLTLSIGGSLSFEGSPITFSDLTRNGTQNGKPKYTNETEDQQIVWTGSAWMIINSAVAPGSPDLFRNTSDTPFPPSSGWSVWNFDASGTPAVAIEAYTEGLGDAGGQFFTDSTDLETGYLRKEDGTFFGFPSADSVARRDASNISEFADAWQVAINVSAATKFIEASNAPALSVISGTLWDRLRPFGPEDKILWRCPISTNLEPWMLTESPPAVSGGAVVSSFGSLKMSTAGAVELCSSWRCKVPYVSVIARVSDAVEVLGPVLTVGLGKKAANLTTRLDPANFSIGTQFIAAQYLFDDDAPSVVLNVNDSVVASVNVPLMSDFEIACCLQGNHLSAWIREDGGAWGYVTGYEITANDYQDPDVIGCMAPILGFAQIGGPFGTIKVTDFRVSEPLGAGIANPSLVHFEDGSPLVDGEGSIYFLANATNFIASGGTTDKCIQASQACIWKYNHSKRFLERTSTLHILRGGRLYGENAGEIVYDRDAGQFILIIPTWGSYDETGGRVDMRMVRTSANILQGSHVLETSAMSVTELPNWDPALVKKDGAWYLAYSRTDTEEAPWSSFYPALASSPDLETWADIPADPDVIGNTEGFKVAWIGGQPYFTSTTTGGQLVYFYDVETLEVLESQGFADLDSSGPPSHAQIVGVPYADKTQYLILSMDKSRWRGVIFSWGNLTVYHLDQFADGWDFEIQRVAP